MIDAPSEIYAFAEEFTDLVGQGGMEFMTMLTKLWDNMSKYEHPKIHGRSIVIEKPTVNIFGGNTVQGFALAVPPEALGNGFMSRMLFVYSEPTGIKVTFPDPINTKLKTQLVDFLSDIRDNFRGELSYSDEAKKVLDSIYKNQIEVDDIRFKHYTTRRFTHHLKLCIIIAASENSKTLTAPIVIKANTLLASIEKKMPKALGEFGKGKYNEVSGTILDILSNATKPMSLNDLYKKVDRDLSKMTELAEIMKSLTYAEKVQVKTVMGKTGYMSKIAELREWPAALIDESYLLPEERM